MIVLDPPSEWQKSDHVAFGPDGGRLVVAFWGSGLAAFNTSDWAMTATHGVRTSGPYGILVSPSGESCFLPAGYGGLIRLSYPDLASPPDLGQAGGDHVRFAALSRDGANLVHTISRSEGTGWVRGLLGYEVSAGKLSQLWQHTDSDWAWLAADFLPDGKAFVSAEYEARAGIRRLTIRSMASGRAERELNCHGKEIAAVSLSPDGNVLVGSSEHSVWVWNDAGWTGKPLKLKNESRKHFTGIAFHPSGKYLAATSNDATVKLYDTETWQVAKTYTWNIGRMRSIAFSPDGTLAAAGSDIGKVVVWDVDV